MRRNVFRTYQCMLQQLHLSFNNNTCIRSKELNKLTKFLLRVYSTINFRLITLSFADLLIMYLLLKFLKGFIL